jgi:Lrp/AsnC family transcriptional regulator, leucine-responsive regulatory protein
MTHNGQLDPTDLKILDLLQQDARMNIARISSKVHKSETATNERIRKLQEKGYIQRYTAVLDRKLLGRPTLMVTLVKLNQHGAQILRDFAAAMNSQPEVQVCLHLSGEFDFLLQISLRSPQEYEAFLDQHLCALPVVEKVHSSLVLRECKMEAALPLP